MSNIMMEESQEAPRISDIMPRSEKKSQNTYFGRVKSCSRLLPIEVAFLVVALLDIVGVITFTLISLISLVTDHPMAKADTDFTFAIIILINTAFCAVYLFSGLFREKMFDMVMLIGSLGIILIYCIADMAITLDHGMRFSPVKIARLALVGVGTAITIPLAVMVLRNFGFLVFNIAGATELLQTLYKRLAFFTSILTLDIQLSIGIVVLVLQQGADVDKGETITLCVGMAAVLLWAVLGFAMSRIENKIGIVIFEVVGVIAYGYIGWKSYIINKHSCTPQAPSTIPPTTSPHPLLSSSTAGGSTTEFYCYTDKLKFATIGAEVLYCIVHAIVLVTGVFILLGFGKGLKEKLKDKDRGVIERIVDHVDT